MGKEALKLSALMIVTYLLVFYGTGAGNDINAAAQGSAGLVKAFQGR